MKKIILSILLFLMFMPYIVKAEKCDSDKISISSISIVDKPTTLTFTLKQ